MAVHVVARSYIQNKNLHLIKYESLLKYYTDLF